MTSKGRGGGDGRLVENYRNRRGDERQAPSDHQMRLKFASLKCAACRLFKSRATERLPSNSSSMSHCSYILCLVRYLSSLTMSSSGFWRHGAQTKSMSATIHDLLAP
ncbi:MAG: hypothetical protein MHMPM18_002169, partial [Marteilia pararefringens]